MDTNTEMTTGNVVAFPATTREPTALPAVEFVAHTQALVDLATGEVRGLEFLARRIDPLCGELQTPGEFMPGMSRRELLQMDLAMAHAVIGFHEATWNSLHGRIDLHVNVSTDLLCDDRHFRMFCEKLNATPFLMQSLVIEVLESPGLTEAALERLQVLRNLGARIALDDFGAGYSSYERLVDCPLDRLKLDRGLVAHLPHNPRAAQVVRSILNLAAQFKLEVVAEGIECQRQAAWLTAQGCQLAQGFFWSAAVSACELAAHIAGGGDIESHLAMQVSASG